MRLLQPESIAKLNDTDAGLEIKLLPSSDDRTHTDPGPAGMVRTSVFPTGWSQIWRRGAWDSGAGRRPVGPGSTGKLACVQIFVQILRGKLAS